MTTAETLASFRGLRALVVGDLALDRWCRYDPALADPSRETGIPRTGVIATEVTAGAAGTVANNLTALGAGKVGVLGLIGDDGFGFELSRRVGGELLVRSPEVCTFTYTKLINHRTGEEDLPRVDFVNTQPIPGRLDRELVSRFVDAAGEYDVILVSDQAETQHGGVVTPAMRAAILRFAAAHREKTVWVDSRMRAEHFHKVVVKPNQEEAEAACRRALGRVDFEELRRHIEAKVLVVTLGARGALVIDDRGAVEVLAKAVGKPVDICGAGDSFSAAAALALHITGDGREAARLGNLAASVTIMKKGTGTASPAEILAAAGEV